MARIAAVAMTNSVLLALAACQAEQRLGAEDCARIRQKLEQVWSRDAHEAQKLADTDGLGRFIADEQRRIGESWAERCRALVGRRVRAEERACLYAADTIDELYECGR